VAEAAFSDGGLKVRLSQRAPISLDVAFSVAPGEILALVGPSGGGKSTTLKAIAGLYGIEDGSVACDGEMWFDAASGTNLSARRRRVGMVFQSYALFPHLTAIENVMEALGDRPKPRRAAEAGAFLARVHLEGLANRRPAELSGGQQQRVAVARALARRPKVLLLDEPFSAVDRMTRYRLQRELAELRRDLSMPIVLITHDLEEAARLADRIAVIHHGRLLQTGNVTEVMSRPSSPAAARLVGIRNIFNGVLLEERTEAGNFLVAWRDHRLETTINAGFAPGARVSWCIPADSVVVHRRDRPSRGEHENPVHGQVRETVRLGETTELVLAIGSGEELPLHCSVPTHVARRNAIEAGAEIGVSLKADAIQLMREDNEADTAPVGGLT
jgi:molybdate transport system ATP-binding protein